MSVALSIAAPPRERALVVDDLRVNRAMLKALVQHECAHITVDEAQDVATALRLLAKTEYDVVLLDLNLGEHGDGMHILRAIRCADRFNTTPVILVSSQEPDDTFIANALREGADDYVSRPVDARVLSARLANARRIRQRYVTLRNEALSALSRVGATDEELRAAAQAQRAMLPKIPVKTPNVRVSAAMVPVGAVSGDSFDVVVSASGAVSMVIIDVTGHGNGPGFVAASITAAIRQSLLLDLPLAYLFKSIEAHVLGAGDGSVEPAAIAIARFLPRSSQLEFANAAMPPALIIDERGAVRSLASSAPPVGMVAGRLPQQQVLSVDDRAVLMLASDGLSGPSGTGEGLVDLWSRIQSFASGEALSRSDSTLVEALIREHLWSYGARASDDATLVVGSFSRAASKPAGGSR